MHPEGDSEPGKLGAMRRHYQRGELRRADLDPDPVEQFRRWMADSVEAGIIEPNAMSLATAGSDGRPKLRTVLLKKYDDRGFVFFTNFESNKARQIAENPEVALLFPWVALERQVIITGSVAKIPARESLAYFISRPRDSQLGAWASPQSKAVESRKVLAMSFAAMKKKFADGDIPLPPAWGGFRVTPRTVEFWQGGAGRLHDRFLYSRTGDGGDGGWDIERLAP